MPQYQCPPLATIAPEIESRICTELHDSSSCRADACPNLTRAPYELETTHLGQLIHMVPDSMPAAEACRTILGGRLIFTVDSFHVVSDQKPGQVLHISADSDFLSLRAVLCDYFESTLGKNWEMLCVEATGGVSSSSGGGGGCGKSSACVRLLRSCKSETAKTINGSGRPPKPDKPSKINVLLAPISRRIVSGTTRQSHCPATVTTETNGVTVDDKAKKKKVLKRIVKQPPSMSSVSVVPSPTAATDPTAIEDVATSRKNGHLPLANGHPSKPNRLSLATASTAAPSTNGTLVGKMTAIFSGRRNSRDASPTDGSAATVSVATVAAVVAAGPNITLTPAENIDAKQSPHTNGSSNTVAAHAASTVTANSTVVQSTTTIGGRDDDLSIKPLARNDLTSEPENEVRKMSVSDILNKLHKIDNNNTNDNDHTTAKIDDSSNIDCFHELADNKLVATVKLNDRETVNDSDHSNENGTIQQRRESYYKDEDDQRHNGASACNGISNAAERDYSNGLSDAYSKTNGVTSLHDDDYSSTISPYVADARIRRNSLRASPAESSNGFEMSSESQPQRSFSLSSRSAEIMHSYAASRGEARSLPPVPTRSATQFGVPHRQPRRQMLSPISSGGSNALSSSSLTEEDEDDIDDDDVTLSTATAPTIGSRECWAARLRAVTDSSLSLSASTSTLKAVGRSSSRFNVEQSRKAALVPTITNGAGDMVRGMINDDVPVIVLQQVLAHFSYHELCELRRVHPHWDEQCGQMLNSAYYQLIHAADRLLTDCQRKVHLEKYLTKPIQVLTNLQVHVINPVDVLRAAIDEGVVCFPYGLLLDKAFELLDRIEFVIRQQKEVGDSLLNWERLAEFARRAQAHYRKVIEPEAERRMAEVYKLSAAQRLQRIDSFLVEASVTKLEKDTEKAKDDMRWELDQLKTQNQQLKKDNRELKQTCLKLDGRIDALERKFKTMARLLQ